MTTELPGGQQKLYEIFGLATWASPELGHTPGRPADRHEFRYEVEMR
jgi:hypothetical protein